MIQPIFLFSLPRSGSTLAQRILAAHPAVATLSEPWILLPFIYTLKDEGIYTDYHQHAAVVALEDFCRELPGGKNDYLREMEKFAISLYTKAAVAKPDALYFLDKTPRYHIISNEVIDLFPCGKFIFLWRNPLSVISSIMETWGEGKWNLYMFKVDLYEGIDNLVAAYLQNRDKSYAIKYEDLIASPDTSWKEIYQYLGLEYDPGVVSAFSNVKLKGSMGDPTGVKNYSNISKEPLEKWKKTIANPIRKSWCKKYLKWIGKERLAVMGYDLEALTKEVDAIPTSYNNIFLDIMNIIYGILYSLLEPRIIKHKYKKLKEWHYIHSHL